MKKFLLAIPLLAAIAISCQEKPQEEKESVKIEGVGETVDIPATPEADFTFTIETNVDWSVAKTNLGRREQPAGRVPQRQFHPYCRFHDQEGARDTGGPCGCA